MFPIDKTMGNAPTMTFYIPPLNYIKMYSHLFESLMEEEMSLLARSVPWCTVSLCNSDSKSLFTVAHSMTAPPEYLYTLCHRYQFDKWQTRERLLKSSHMFILLLNIKVPFPWEHESLDNLQSQESAQVWHFHKACLSDSIARMHLYLHL